MSTQPPAPGDNSANAYKLFLDQMRELGRVKGRGANAQIEAAVQCVERASEGIIDVKNTEEVYDAFLGGETQAGGATGTANEEKSDRTVRISELRQFVKMGGIKTIDPVALIHNAVTWIRNAKQVEKLGKGVKVYSAMVDVARAQNKIPEHALTEDECIAAAQPKAGRDKDEADYWGQVRDRIDKIEKKFGTSDEITRIRDQVQLVIDDLGGTSADRKKAEKAAKELAKLQGKTPAAAPAPAGKKGKGKK
jgi:hypothetical protein